MSGLAFDRLARDWAAALDAQASHDLAAQLAACDRLHRALARLLGRLP